VGSVAVSDVKDGATGVAAGVVDVDVVDVVVAVVVAGAVTGEFAKV